ncbi:MAG TPA: FAD/NAD(P)-binding protein [Acidimicrobiales bacterium]|jgi:uncharacterized NAD(P)/FAD-binding protein YdhS|nr:FAD/NAD(P)-binding protein [Acidimicrobiales bacterium]
MVAVIGGGATGLAVVRALDAATTKTQIRFDVLLIEASGVVGPGLAYGTDDAGHLINMPAATMGFGDPADFQRWRAIGCEEAETATPFREAVSPYPPRSVYGQYLSSIASRLLEQRDGSLLSVRVLADQVVALVENRQRVMLRLKRHGMVPVDSAVLAIGALPPTTYGELHGTPGYIPSPWPHTALRAIPPGDNVTILGSSLTAIDAARSLVGRGHTGSITFVSRHGHLPKVQGNTADYRGASRLRHRLLALIECGPPSWDQVLAILRDEIAQINDGDPWDLQGGPSDPLEFLRKEITSAQTGRTRWQEVLMATSGIVETLWHAMTAGEKAHFDHALSSAWMSNRHPMPLPNALFLRHLLEQKQLTILRCDGPEVVFRTVNGGGFVFDTDGCHAPSRWMINCTGVGRDVTKARSPLLRQLLASGQLMPHPSGGVAVDFASFRALDRGGRQSRRLFVVGPLTRGVHFYTHAIERHLEHARRVASELVERHPAILHGVLTDASLVRPGAGV